MCKLFCYADFAGDSKDSRSVSGLMLIFANGAAGWTSQKQIVIATSTVQAEYFALNETVNEVEWLIDFFKEIQHEEFLERPITVYADNQSAIANSGSDCVTKQNRHFKAKYHSVREAVRSRKIEFQYVKPSLNRADFLTKVLNGQMTKENARGIGPY